MEDFVNKVPEEAIILSEKLYELEEVVKKAKAFLFDTDWYYTRKLETGEEVPPVVVQKRLEAREFIRLNESPGAAIAIRADVA